MYFYLHIIFSSFQQERFCSNEFCRNKLLGTWAKARGQKIYKKYSRVNRINRVISKIKHQTNTIGKDGWSNIAGQFHRASLNRSVSRHITYKKKDKNWFSKIHKSWYLKRALSLNLRRPRAQFMQIKFPWKVTDDRGFQIFHPDWLPYGYLLML